MGLFSSHSPPAMTLFPSPSRMKASSMEPATSFFSHLAFRQRFPDPASHASMGSHRSMINPQNGPTQGARVFNTCTPEALKQEIHFKDKDLVFVAGATGRVGSRTVRELLKLGFRVRAGVRSTQRAEVLVQCVREVKLDGVVDGSVTQPVERLEIIECDLENKGAIKAAIGNASTVICCIGASEKEIFDVTGPYRIDYQAAKNLIEAATVAKVDHFILLTSLGTNKIGFPASILNLFWGVLIWKRKAEEALIASGLPYTILRPGGMERPTDSYKETHNIVLANEDTYVGGQVSNLQVAELIAFMAKSKRLSLYKVVEVIAETTAPLTPMEVLLAKIPSHRELQDEGAPHHLPLLIEPDPSKPVVEEEPSQIKVPKERSLSPYTVYDEFKPPTSPSPCSPVTGSSNPTTATGGDSTKSSTSQIPTAEDEQHIKNQLHGPLSPFTMYEDLKPPTSPMPSVPKY